jgi:hypothetical protein
MKPHSNGHSNGNTNGHRPSVAQVAAAGLSPLPAAATAYFGLSEEESEALYAEMSHSPVANHVIREMRARLRKRLGK